MKFNTPQRCENDEHRRKHPRTGITFLKTSFQNNPGYQCSAGVTPIAAPNRQMIIYTPRNRRRAAGHSSREPSKSGTRSALSSSSDEPMIGAEV